ncbi:hypothetical protein [Halobacillus litoralis]|uniref:hypothetical protein n=1 Tax=Halobacillus litoralis TaxID=45668 RepID=UPI001CD204A0|nr:hypothetical protein [Halobacillus litoralis]MCA1021661.1 hypothetical protein [Halobacillus litoralis]
MTTPADAIKYAQKYTNSKLMPRRIPVKKPSGFTWDAPINIWTDGNGRFETDFDVSQYQHTGKTYYVDVKNGSDSNDGLALQSAFKTIHKALGKSDVDVILINDGLYYDDLGFNRQTVGKNLSLKAINDGKVTIMQGRKKSYSLASGKTKTYQSSEYVVYAVYDAKFKDEYGDYKKLDAVSSIDEVEVTPNSFYVDGSSYYVHTSDSRVPDDDIRVFRNYPLFTFTGNKNLYMQGLNLEGGRYPFQFSNADGTSPANVYGKNCTAKYGNLQESFTILGATNAFFQGCIAARSFEDGFNYHILNGVTVNSIEVDCIGRHNGSEGHDHDNGSTNHDGGKSVRVNCVYFENVGSNVGDIDAGTQSWNVGVISFDSACEIVDRYKSNFTARTDDELWMDGCISYGSLNGLLIENGGLIHQRNCRIEGEELIESTGLKDNY